MFDRRAAHKAIAFVFWVGISLCRSMLLPGQHCGGPCEVPRSVPPISHSFQYQLTAGTEVANWRYLFNWHWTVDGVQKYSLEKTLSQPPCRNFAFRRMFVSPAGNGVLVTGNPYVKSHIQHAGKETCLFVFCAPDGEIVDRIPIEEVLGQRDLRPGPCPSCECQDVLYRFFQDPRMSINDCYVTWGGMRDNWDLNYFLPLGCLVENRKAFEKALVVADWARLERGNRRVETEQQLSQQIEALQSADPLRFKSAIQDLLKIGLVAKDSLENAQQESESGSFRGRAQFVLDRLRPAADLTWEELARDRDMLATLLHFEEVRVRKRVRASLTRLVPAIEDIPEEQWSAWLQENYHQLHWDARQQQYQGT